MLLDLQETVTHCDRSHSDFARDAKANGKARRGGRPLERRSDCSLDLALLLDRSGFVQRPKTVVGNLSEPGTLTLLLAGPGTPAGARVRPTLCRYGPSQACPISVRQAP